MDAKKPQQHTDPLSHSPATSGLASARSTSDDDKAPLSVAQLAVEPQQAHSPSTWIHDRPPIAPTTTTPPTTTMDTELPPLSNASIALAEFASLLSGPDGPSGNQYLKEHITHLLSNVDSSNTLATVARALESAQVRNGESESTVAGAFDGSVQSDSRLQTTTSTLPDTGMRRRHSRPLWAGQGDEHRPLHRGSLGGGDAERRRSTFGFSQTDTNSHFGESSKTNDDDMASPHSADLMMGDNGSVMNEQPLLFSSLIGGSMSGASTTSSAALMDPLEQESPSLPNAVRLEGRRAAVSAIPSGLLSSMAAPHGGLGTSIAAASTSTRSGSHPAEPVTPQETEKLTGLVKASHLFSSLDTPELTEVVQAMRKESYPAGTAVLEQGQDSKEKLFLIFEGTCEAIKQGKTLAAMQVGATFGELELMYKQIKCAATIRCVTNCVFFTLNEEAYHRAVMHDSMQKRRRFEQLTESAPFLRCLPQYERNKVAEALHTVQFKKGQRMIRFGEKSSHLYFIIDGQVRVVGRSQGRKVEVVRLHKGDVVGELEFLFNHLAVADVVVVSRRLRAARISREHFELIIGPIPDRLKEFIATSPSYEQYYVKSVADESVRSELSRASSTQRLRPRRVESASGRAESLTLLNVDPEGEMVISAPIPLIGGLDTDGLQASADAREGDEIVRHEVDPREVAQRAFRFPLAPVTRNRWVLIGLREDGLILTWNKMCEKLTDYSAEEVVGQNIYSLLLEAADQKAMYHAIAHAKKYAGTVEDFGTDIRATHRRKYTIARSDGLTKAVVELSVLPPVMARGCDETPEMVLAIGEEVSQGPQKALDQTHWLSKQVRLILADGELTYELRLQRIAETLANYEDVYRAMTLSTERLRVVNIHQMMGVVVMDFAVECVQKRIAVCQRFEGLPSESAYLDAELLPQCLRYAMRTTVQYNESCQLTITVTVTEKSGLEFLVINFNVTGGAGFPEVYEEYVNMPLDDADDETFLATVRTSRTTVTTAASSDSGTAKQISQLRRVRLAVEQQGGTIRIGQAAPDTANIFFLIPYMEAQEVGDAAGDKSMGQSTANDRANNTTTGIGESHASVSLTNTDSALSLPTGGTDLLFGDSTPRSGGMMGGSSAGASGAAGVGESVAAPDDGPAYNFTTLVAEDTPAHRNMLCAYLWERRHAVLPAYSLSDIERLSGVADILFIDLQQSIMSSLTTQDPIALLREKARQMAVIITATDFDMVSAETYQKAGFITLKKPCTPVQALQAIRKAEDKIAAVKQEAERIAKTRETLAKNSRGAWKRGALLGKGSFGEVYEAIDVLTGGKMAVKELRLGGQNNVKVENFVDEISTMCNLQHPNIIHYFYCEQSMEGAHKVFRVFMEFAAGGTLQGLRSKKGKLPFAEFQRLLHDVTEGLAYIHAQNYVHGDIKTANVLLGHDEKGKIGDFGTARRIKEGELLYDMQGSPLYMSPECMSAGELNEEGERIGYSYPTDIWSLGCVVLEMVTGKQPFSHIKKFNGPAGFTNFITSLTDTPDLSPLFGEPPSVTEFVSACLKPEPSERATAEDLLRMSVFSETTDDDTKSAVKALKRAQLLHILNKFVAFQDPEEIQEKERQKNQFVTRQRSVTDFFASSSSSSSSSDRGGGDGGSAQAAKEAKPAAQPPSRKRDFFSSSSSEAGSDKGSAPAPAGPAVPAQKPSPAAGSAEGAGEADRVDVDYTPVDFPERRKSFRDFIVGSDVSSTDAHDTTLATSDKPRAGDAHSWARAAREAAMAASKHNPASSLNGPPGFGSATARPRSAYSGGSPTSPATAVTASREVTECEEAAPNSGTPDEPGIRLPQSPDDADMSPTPKKRSRTRARDEVVADDGEDDEHDGDADDAEKQTRANGGSATPPLPLGGPAGSRTPPPAASPGTSYDRSSSRHNAHSTDSRPAMPGLTNASFVNFSFNRNISFMGANMNDVLNSVANEFMNTLAGVSAAVSEAGTHSHHGSVQGASAVSHPSSAAAAAAQAQANAAAASATAGTIDTRYSSTTAEDLSQPSHPAAGAAAEGHDLPSVDETSGGPPSTLSSRPAVVKAWLQKKLKRAHEAAPLPLSNRSFFMVQEVDNSRLGSSMRGSNPHSTVEGAPSTTNSAAQNEDATTATDRDASPPAADSGAAPPISLFIPNAVLGDADNSGGERRRAAVVVAPPPPNTTTWNLSSSDSDTDHAHSGSTALLTDAALRPHRASFTESADQVQQFLTPVVADAVATANGSGGSASGSAAITSAALVRIETELQSIAGRLKHLIEERVRQPSFTDPLSPPARPAAVVAAAAAASRTASHSSTTPKNTSNQQLPYVLPVSAVQPTGSAPLVAELPRKTSSHTDPELSADKPVAASRPASASASNPLAPALDTVATSTDADPPLEGLHDDMEGLLDHVERLQSFVAEQRNTNASPTSTLDPGALRALAEYTTTTGESQLLAALQKFDHSAT